MVEYAERNVPGTARDVDAPERAARTRLETRHEVVLPQPVYTHGHSIVHEVVRGRDTVEHIAHERLLCLLRHRLEAEVCRPLVVATVRARRRGRGRRILVVMPYSGEVPRLGASSGEDRPRVRETESSVHRRQWWAAPVTGSWGFGTIASGTPDTLCTLAISRSGACGNPDFRPRVLLSSLWFNPLRHLRPHGSHCT